MNAQKEGKRRKTRKGSRARLYVPDLLAPCADSDANWALRYVRIAARTDVCCVPPSHRCVSRVWECELGRDVRTARVPCVESWWETPEEEAPITLTDAEWGARVLKMFSEVSCPFPPIVSCVGCQKTFTTLPSYRGHRHHCRRTRIR